MQHSLTPEKDENSINSETVLKKMNIIFNFSGNIGKVLGLGLRLGFGLERMNIIFEKMNVIYLREI